MLPWWAQVLSTYTDNKPPSSPAYTLVARTTLKNILKDFSHVVVSDFQEESGEGGRDGERKINFYDHIHHSSGSVS